METSKMQLYCWVSNLSHKNYNNLCVMLSVVSQRIGDQNTPWKPIRYNFIAECQSYCTRTITCVMVSGIIRSANRWPKYAMETNKIQLCCCQVSKLLHQDYNMCHGVSSKSANQWPIIRYGINQSVAKYLRPKTTKKTTKKLPAFFYNGSRKVQIIHWKHPLWGAG